MIENAKKAVKGGFWIACKDYRVWILALVYAGCFGVEIVIHNTAANYFKKAYTLDLQTAGFIAGLFGGLAIFARGMGGYISDRVAHKYGLKGANRDTGTVFVRSRDLPCFYLPGRAPFPERSRG